MPYKYDEPNKVLREMPTMERPYPGNIPPQTREGQQELQLAFARYNRHIANLKSYPLTSPIKGLKDGEVAEENVHFKVAYRIWFCGIKGERESEFMYSTKEFMDTHYPNDYETVAIPLTKEEPKKGIDLGDFLCDLKGEEPLPIEEDSKEEKETEDTPLGEILSTMKYEPESNELTEAEKKDWIIKEDNICPATNELCDDECCPTGAECNLKDGTVDYEYVSIGEERIDLPIYQQPLTEDKESVRIDFDKESALWLETSTADNLTMLSEFGAYIAYKVNGNKPIYYPHVKLPNHVTAEQITQQERREIAEKAFQAGSNYTHNLRRTDNPYLSKSEFLDFNYPL